MTVKSLTQKVETKTTNIIYTPALKFEEADRTFPYRLVGSYEYGTALTHLGELIESSTPEQIAVYDKLIQSRPEYSYHSGVAMELGLDARLDSANASKRQEMEAKYLKHSLAWMMALARVELGATISMYGDTDDPFGAAVAVGGGEFGAEEYLSILLDDSAAHLKSAQMDVDYQRGLSPKEKVDAGSLAHLRRTQLISEMLNKVISSGDSEIISVAGPYAQMAQQMTDQLTEKITVATTSYAIPVGGSESSSTRRSSRTTGLRFENRYNLRQCQLLLESQYGPPQTTSSPLQ